MDSHGGNIGFPRRERRFPTLGTSDSHGGNKTIQPCRADSLYAKHHSNMQNVIQIGQVVQPSVLSNVGRTVKNLKAWLSAKSPSFSALAGEDVSRADVVKAHLYLFIVFVIGVVVSQMGG